MANYLIHLFITYRYLILVPLAVINGQSMSLLSGFLGRFGLINPIIAGIIIILSNIFIGDTILYWLGYHQGHKFVTRYGKYIGITEYEIEKVKKIFHKYHSPVLIISKLTSGFGLAVVVLFTAGMSKVPFRKYILLNILGDIIFTGSLVAVGFFFGQLYTTVDNVIFRVSLIVIILAIIYFVIFRLSNYAKSKINHL